MVTILTALFEKAMTSSSDKESLACLKEAKKLYRGDGISLSLGKNGPPMVPKSEMDAKLKVLQETLAKVQTDNRQLTAENSRLRSKTTTIKAQEMFTPAPAVKKKINLEGAVFVGFIIGFIILLIIKIIL